MAPIHEWAMLSRWVVWIIHNQRGPLTPVLINITPLQCICELVDADEYAWDSLLQEGDVAENCRLVNGSLHSKYIVSNTRYQTRGVCLRSHATLDGSRLTLEFHLVLPSRFQ